MGNLEFGKKLIQVRKAHGLTQEDVAAKSGISVRTIQRIESGIVKPRAFTIKLISETLGFDLYENPDSGTKKTKAQNTLSRRNILYLHLKDLSNLKNNTMKKLSILTDGMAIILLGFFLLNYEILGQESSNKNSVTVRRDNTNSVERIDVRFSNYLTYDSLIL